MESSQPIQPSQASLKSYASMHNQLQKVIGGELSHQSILENWNAINSFIENNPKPFSHSTRKNYYSYLMKLSKEYENNDVYKKAEEKFKLYACQKMLELQTQEPTEKEKEGILTADEIKEKIEYLKLKTPDNIDDYEDYRKLLKYIIVLFYQDVPLRNDLVNTRLFFEKDFKTKTELNDRIQQLLTNKQNFILITDGKTQILTPSFISLSTYKTSWKYNEKRIKLSEEVVNEFKRYKKAFNDYSNDNFFVINQDGNPMTTNNLTKFFNGIFKAPISSTMLRKSAVSEVHKPEAGKLKKQLELAHKMGHDLKTAQLHYAKILQ